jgi:hypothetical protein
MSSFGILFVTVREELMAKTQGTSLEQFRCDLDKLVWRAGDSARWIVSCSGRQCKSNESDADSFFCATMHASTLSEAAPDP